MPNTQYIQYPTLETYIEIYDDFILFPCLDKYMTSF
jgi:hypothetical protein